MVEFEKKNWGYQIRIFTCKLYFKFNWWRWFFLLQTFS